MTDLLVSFYLGGYFVGLLNAYETSGVTLNKVLYLLLWPFYAIITMVEILSINSSTIINVVKKVYEVCKNCISWFIGLFKK